MCYYLSYVFKTAMIIKKVFTCAAVFNIVIGSYCFRQAFRGHWFPGQHNMDRHLFLFDGVVGRPNWKNIRYFKRGEFQPLF